MTWDVCPFFLRYQENMTHLALLRLLFITMVCAATSLGSDCDCDDTPKVTPGYPFAYPLPYTHPFPQPVFTSKVGQYKCSCKPKRAGQLKFSGGKLFVCTGTEWKALQYEQSVLYGSKLTPGSSCEDIQKKTLKQSANGVYWITLLSGEIHFIQMIFKFSETG